MGRKNRSLCEKSSDIAVNLIKTSSLWMARMTLRPPPSSRGPSRRSAPPLDALPPPPPPTRTKRLLEPESNPAAFYLLEPDQGDGVDGRAADYITRFREKNRRDSSVVRSEASNCIPPPPPRAKWMVR